MGKLKGALSSSGMDGYPGGGLMGKMKGLAGMKGLSGMKGLAGMAQGAMDAASAAEAAAPGGRPKRLGVVECVGMLLNQLRTIPMMVGQVVTALPMLYAALWALGMLLLIFAVILLFMYLVYVLSPRVPVFHHSDDVEGYVADTYTVDLLAALQTLQTSGVGLDWLECVSES